MGMHWRIDAWEKRRLYVNDTNNPHLFNGRADNLQEKETGLDLL